MFIHQHGFSKNDAEEVSINVFRWHFLLLLLVLGCDAHNQLLLLPALLCYLPFQYTCTALVYLLGFICFPGGVN